MYFKKLLSNEFGYSLILVTFTLVMITIIGLSLLSISTNSLKTTTGERDSQSTYYIAESALVETRFEIEALATKAYNDLIEEYNELDDLEKNEFINNKTMDKRYIELVQDKIDYYVKWSNDNRHFQKLYDVQFDEANPPKADIVVELENLTSNEIKYEITSTGMIGKNIRKLSQIVTISLNNLPPPNSNLINPPNNKPVNFCAVGDFDTMDKNGNFKDTSGNIIFRKDTTLYFNHPINGTIYVLENATAHGATDKKVEIVKIESIENHENSNNCIVLGTPTLPTPNFLTSTNSITGSGEITFTKSNKELHYLLNKNNTTDTIKIFLPKDDSSAIYSLFVNSLENKNIEISGSGKLNIYVQESNILSIGNIKSLDRTSFDTTVYYPKIDQQDSTNIKINNFDASLVMNNINTKNNLNLNITGDGNDNETNYGNFIVLGNSSLSFTNKYDNAKAQVLYFPEGDISASTQVTLEGYIRAKSISTSGNVSLKVPSDNDFNSMIKDIFAIPSNNPPIEVPVYEDDDDTTDLLTGETLIEIQ